MPAIKTKLFIVLLLACSIGCGGPPSSPSGSGDSSDAVIPELTDDIIKERINRAWIREVPPDPSMISGTNVSNPADGANGTNAMKGSANDTNVPHGPTGMDSPPPEPISWNFDPDEPKEINIVDKQVNGTHATIVLDIKTSSAPRSRNRLELAGQIRTEWQLRTGWVLRKWEITDIENISMKYKRLPKPSPTPNENGNAAPSR